MVFRNIYYNALDYLKYYSSFKEIPSSYFKFEPLTLE